MMGLNARWMVQACFLGVLGALGIACSQATALDFPGPAPGTAVLENRGQGGLVALSNNVLRMGWRVTDKSLRPAVLEDKISGKAITLDSTECFELVLTNTPLRGQRTVRASELKVLNHVALLSIPANPSATRLADRQAGHLIRARLASADGQIEVIWQAILRDGSNYVQQVISCEAKRQPVELTEAIVWNLAAPGAEVRGVVDGSPVVVGNWFFAAEHPMGKSRVVVQDGSAAPRLLCSYVATGGLEPGQPRRFRSLVGIVPEGQLRRGFLYYLERERAQPYRPFLHYNNGTDIGDEYWACKPGAPREAFRRGQERQWLKRIDAFGRELVAARKVVVDSFVHDHDWDDENLVWQFHDGYPNGFRPAQEEAARCGGHLGVWFSPFGGYAAHKARVEAGRKQGFETYRLGLTLAGPRYFARFLAACEGLVDRYDLNYFKFDGFGASNNQPGAVDCGSDLQALLEVIARLRAKKADLFINTSTGSWPSPFWLLHADCIWRQGADTGIGGKGTPRQKWVTYRDGLIHSGVVARGPLYPINSLMIHGIYVNRIPLSFGPQRQPQTYDAGEITSEIRSFFATGVNLQEMYIVPEFMTPRTWDVLAEAARWSRCNAEVLVDTHPIGGDALAGQVYGWASWTPAKAILALRNPDDQHAAISLDVGKAWELPSGAAAKYLLKSPWAEDAAKQTVEIRLGQVHQFQLQPFEVVILEATPVQ